MALPSIDTAPPLTIAKLSASNSISASPFQVFLSDLFQYAFVVRSVSSSRKCEADKLILL